VLRAGDLSAAASPVEGPGPFNPLPAPQMIHPAFTIQGESARIMAPMSPTRRELRQRLSDEGEDRSVHQRRCKEGPHA
jgi:hypothetical protein